MQSHTGFKPHFVGLQSSTSDSLDGVCTLILHRLCLCLLGIASQDNEAIEEDFQGEIRENRSRQSLDLSPKGISLAEGIS